MMDLLKEAVEAAIGKLIADEVLPPETPRTVILERTRDPVHGDFATNAALTLARAARRNPRELADLLCAAIDLPRDVERTEIAGPGFINFFVHGSRWQETIQRILGEGAHYGRCQAEPPQKILLEFVSANPTGPLHVGHGRGAAYGASLGNILEAAGHSVHREYYVNDMGRQMNILAASVAVRGLQELGHDLHFPENGYRGDYILTIARDLVATRPELLNGFAADALQGMPQDSPEAPGKEIFIDALIQRLESCLGQEAFDHVRQFALGGILADIRDDLEGFGVHFDEWYSERSLGNSGRIEEELQRLDANGHLFTRDGATWFRSTSFGDDKDRVLRRDNGQTTYFASDVAYHLDKFERGFDRCINIWGADHHGYVPRVKAALQALEMNPELLDIYLVQFANLYRGKEKLAMSTRSGSFVTLRELREEVGDDAARFFYVMRKSDQHMDFDLDLAKSESRENPVYYVQYAHARVCSVMEKLREQGLEWNEQEALDNLERLDEDAEQELLTKLDEFPQVVMRAAEQAAPHSVANYLRELAARFHVWYNAHRALVEDSGLRNARVALCLAVRQVVANGLALLGVSAPEKM